MFLHGFKKIRSRRKAHQKKCIGICTPDKPFSAWNIEINVKKMNVCGECIHNKKMGGTTDPKSGFGRSCIECKKYVDIKKGSQDADRKKKHVGLGSGAIENSQTGKPEKAAQCQ